MVLVVEDDPIARKSLAVLLRNRGYNVKDVGTYAEAWEATKVEMPKVLILDLMLPCSRIGSQLLEECRDRPGMTHCKVIVTTGLPRWVKKVPSDVAVLNKPFDFDLLLTLMGPPEGTQQALPQAVPITQTIDAVSTMIADPKMSKPLVERHGDPAKVEAALELARREMQK